MTSLWCRELVALSRKAVVPFVCLLSIGVTETQGIAETHFIPSVSVRNIYDSNVFYTPKRFLEPGTQAEDFEIAVIPQLNLAHTNSLISGNLMVGATIARYMNNPALDFTGYNAAGSLNLKGLAEKISRRLTNITVSGAYQFVPVMSGFQAAGGGMGMGFGATGAGPMGAGLVTNRVSMNTLQLGASGGYQLDPTTTITTAYQYTKLAFGDQFGGANNALFDMVGHASTTTLTRRLNPRDSMGLTATASRFEMAGASNGAGQEGDSQNPAFMTIGGTANWSRMWTHRVTSSLAGGGLLVPPMEFHGQNTKTMVVPTATASISYTSVSESLRAASATPGPFDGMPRLMGSLTPGVVIPAGKYTAAMMYTYSVFPSFAYGAGPIKTHLIGANLDAGITSKMTGRVGTNVARGSMGDSLTGFSFTTIGATAGVSYLLGPVLADLSYNFLGFSSEVPAAQAQNNFAFSKHMLVLSLSTAFNSQAFFKMGGLQSTVPQEPAESSVAPAGATGPVGPSGPGPGPGSLRRE